MDFSAILLKTEISVAMGNISYQMSINTLCWIQILRKIVLFLWEGKDEVWKPAAFLDDEK